MFIAVVSQPHTLASPTSKVDTCTTQHEMGAPVSSVGSSSGCPSFSLTSICLPPQSASFTNLGHKNIAFNLTTKTKPKKQYQCAECLKIFSRPSALQTHSYTHTAEKPFKCTSPNCGRSFSVVSNLRRHFKVHQKQSNKNKLSSEDRLRCVRKLMENSDAILSGRHPSSALLNRYKPLSPAPVAVQQPLHSTFYQTPSPSPPPKEQQPTPQEHFPQLSSILYYPPAQHHFQKPTPFHQNRLSITLPAIQSTSLDRDLPSLIALGSTSTSEGLFLNSLNYNNSNSSEHYDSAHSTNGHTPYSESSVLTPADKSFPSYFDYDPYC